MRWWLALVSVPLTFALAALPAVASAQPPSRTERGGPTMAVAARAATGVQPKSVNVSPDGRRVVVCNFGRPDRDSVFVYDAITLARTGAVTFEGNAVESAFSPDGATLYVSNFRRHRVEVIDFESLEVRQEIAVGTNPKTVAVSADGRTLYVANYFDRSVSVVDLAEGREVRRLRTGARPRGLGVMGDGSLLAAAFHGDRIHHFAEGASEERAHWDVCRYPRDILPFPDGHGFYLTCSLGTIGFYRLDGGGRPFVLAATGRNPRSIGRTADGRFVGVANFTSSDVTIIDTVRRTHRNVEVPGARRIVGLAMHPGPGLRLYATSWDTNEVIALTGEVPE
ncbi:MAG: YncE family protein [Sandaracinaceae bacterium]|nr:YncE family protein [Sandaracinaceae bacterium]